MKITRTTVGRGSDDDMLASLSAMENAGWAVRSLVPASWSEQYNTGYFVVYEREDTPCEC